MKKLLAILLLLSVSAFGGARLEWDYPAEHIDKVAGYRVWRQEAGGWQLLADTGTNRTWNIALSPGDYTVAVSAYAAGNVVESERSTPLTFTILVAVANLRIVQP